jgi:hypothetical protein
VLDLIHTSLPCVFDIPPSGVKTSNTYPLYDSNSFSFSFLSIPSDLVQNYSKNYTILPSVRFTYNTRTLQDSRKFYPSFSFPKKDKIEMSGLKNVTDFSDFVHTLDKTPSSLTATSCFTSSPSSSSLPVSNPLHSSVHSVSVYKYPLFLDICISPTTGAFSLEDFLLGKKRMLQNAVVLINHVRSYYTDDLFFKLSLLFFFFFVVFVKLIVFNTDIVERLLEVIKYFIAVLCKRAEKKKSKQKTCKHQVGKKIVKVASNSNNNNVKSCESKISITSTTLNELFKKIPPFKRIDGLNLECGLHLCSPPPPPLTSPDFVNRLYNPDEAEVEFKTMFFITEILISLGSKIATSADTSYLTRIKKVFF